MKFEGLEKKRREKKRRINQTVLVNSNGDLLQLCTINIF